MRLVTYTGNAPCSTRCLAASSLILPAPISSTARPARPAKIFLASSTAANETDTAWRAMSVSVRTRLATLKAWLKSVCSRGPTVSQAWASAKASFTWPRICGSPIIIESRLAATRKAWRTASLSRCV